MDWCVILCPGNKSLVLGEGFSPPWWLKLMSQMIPKTRQSIISQDANAQRNSGMSLPGHSYNGLIDDRFQAQSKNSFQVIF